MIKADRLFVQNMREIKDYGCWDENPRPRYEDGTNAHSIFITQVFEKYDLEKGEFPITNLRPIPIINGVKEIQWIYQDQTSDLSVLEEDYGIGWWQPWNIGDGTIGIRYGETVARYDLMNSLLTGLATSPFGRRHILNLWQEQDFAESLGLPPCAFMTMFSVRKVNGVFYLDMTLTQRSSDYLVAGHINKMQYVAFQMMVAKHCGYQVGNFVHYVQNLHIYDRHLEQLDTLLDRSMYEPVNTQAILKLNVPDGTDFYNIYHTDFELVNYEPVKPQLKFDLGI
jgi:thymidylate synthase